MAKAILFGVLGLFAGFVTNFAGFMLMEAIGYFAHPYPPGFKMDDHEAVIAYIRSYPDWLLGVAVGMWGISVMGGAWVSTRIGGRVAGILCSVSLLILYYCNLWEHPYPFWFDSAVVVSVPICLFIGYQMAAAKLASSVTVGK